MDSWINNLFIRDAKWHQWQTHYTVGACLFCAWRLKQQLSSLGLSCLSLWKNNEAIKKKGEEIDWTAVQLTSFYDLEVVSLPFAPSETLVSVQVSTLSRTCDSDSKSSDWLFPMSETSAPAGRCYRLLICTRFHGPGAAHSSFRKGDYRAGQMASHMHLGTAVAAAQFKTPAYWKLKEHNWNTIESYQVTLIGLTAADG